MGMARSTPICCDPTAYQSIRAVAPIIETSDGLLQAMLTLSSWLAPDFTTKDVESTLQRYANTVKARVHGQQSQALVAHLNEYLFEELGFFGNDAHFYAVSNFCLPAMLRGRTGIPGTLAVIYKLVGEHCGLTIHGIGIPGNFCVQVICNGKPMYLDVYGGGMEITAHEIEERVNQVYEGGDLEGWTAEHLEVCSHREWFTRILQTLLNMYSENSDYYRVASVLEMETILYPTRHTLKRDLALTLARMGNHPRHAQQLLAEYISLSPSDPHLDDLQMLLDALKED